MDIIDEIIKNARKEFQKTRIQTKGFLSRGRSMMNRKDVQKKSEIEARQAQQSLSKNSSELKQAIKGKFAKKLSKAFEKQKKTLDNA